MDHGQEGKSALYEQGIRHAQFVHFPNEISAGTQFNGLVSTIDIAPTILDYAGVSSTYSMDGASWKGAWEDSSSAEYFENERCLFFEIQHDRAVRCGCHKFLRFSDADSGWTAELADEYGFAKATEILYNLCDGSGNYVTSGSTAPEQTDVSSSDPTTFDAMKALMDCHDAKVKSQSGVSPDYSECESSLSSTTRRKLFGLK